MAIKRDAIRRAAELCEAENAVIACARSLLARIDNLTTHEFERGGDQIKREALRTALDRLAVFV